MNIQQIKQFLSRNQTWARKNYGQHFLVDDGVLNQIITAAELEPSDHVLEIGPGLGVLTEKLVEKAGKVVAIEADEFLAKFVEDKFGKNKKLKIKNKKCDADSINYKLSGSGLENENFQLIKGDALQVIDSLEFKKSFRSKPYKVVANIPYSITSKLLRLLLSEYQPTSLTLLVQKEVAERICAKPGQMSLLSLSVQYFGDPKIISKVSASSFWPPPKVESAIIKIAVSCQVSGARKQEEGLFRIAKIGFSSKRKTLANNLSSALKIDRETITDIIKSVGLKETVRAQELSLEEWGKLADQFKPLCKNTNQIKE